MDVSIFEKLSRLIALRKREPVEGSYTCVLFNEGDNKIIKKLGEENAEYIKAYFTGDDDELAGEAADYIYHLMVSLEQRGVSFEKVVKVLSERHK